MLARADIERLTPASISPFPDGRSSERIPQWRARPRCSELGQSLPAHRAQEAAWRHSYVVLHIPH
ncbi:MAG: hypothetical protein ACRDJG_01650, partial [Actinomycetota bacterium]